MEQKVRHVKCKEEKHRHGKIREMEWNKADARNKIRDANIRREKK